LLAKKQKYSKIKIMKKVDDPAKNIGQYLAYQRKKRNLTLADLAEKCGLSISYLSKLEDGQYGTATFDVIQDLAHGLDMRTADFLRKCDLISGEAAVTPIEYSLKELCFLPNTAIEEVMAYIDYICHKYQKEIKAKKIEHRQYWQKEPKKS